MSDELARERQDLPWVPLDKEFTLQTADGPKTLAELFDGRSHLEAHDVTMVLVSGAPIEKLLAYRERMGWTFNWASSYESDFAVEPGFSSRLEDAREWVTPMIDELPPIAASNARATATDLVSYLVEGFGFSVFTLQDGVVYETYSTTGRGVEFLMI
jgi:predicted dithiol-disulfide oxidoreductase (DUF899 family)